MGLFKRNPANCGVCGKETGIKGNKKYEVIDGCICQDCCDKVGLMLNFCGTIKNGTGPRHFISKGDSIEDIERQIAEKERKFNQLELLKNFNKTRILANIVYINDERREWYINIGGTFSPPEIYSMNNIVDVWSNSNYSEKVIDTTIKEGGIGRAVAGGLIAGPVGAVVGAITRKEEASSRVESSHLGIVSWIQIDENGEAQSHSVDVGVGKTAADVEHVLRSFIDKKT